MRIRANQRVGISDLAAVLLMYENRLCDVLQIHLMHDTDIRRDDTAVLECLLSPLQKHISFAIALQFPLGIESEGARSAELIHLNRVIDNEVDLLQRIDLSRI